MNISYLSFFSSQFGYRRQPLEEVIKVFMVGFPFRHHFYSVKALKDRKKTWQFIVINIMLKPCAPIIHRFLGNSAHWSRLVEQRLHLCILH